jgi:dihydrolipoamide dehydrogenase
VERFDTIVIGAGPGGYVAAIRAAQLGLSVALVEKEPAPGGTCLHWGCIPTKALLHSAWLLDHARRAASAGIAIGEVAVDLPGVMKRKQSAVRRLAGGVGGLLKQNGVTLIQGRGSLRGAGRVQVEGPAGDRELSAGHVVLATGSVPTALPHVPFDGTRIVSSNEAIAFTALPERLLVIGAGAVGLELAVVWSRFGSAVTVVELMPAVLPGGDPELSADLAAALGKHGIDIRTGTTVTAARAAADGVAVTLESRAGGAKVEEAYAAVLVAVGRRAALEDIGLESIGLAPVTGRLEVDPWGRTAVPGVFAIGDIVPGPQLAHLASAEGIVAVETIAGHRVPPVNRAAVPSCVYTDPEAASVGLTEDAAKAAGHDVKTARFPFLASGKALVEGEQTGWVKFVADRATGQVLGAHILGPHATELIAEATLAIGLECTLEELARTVHAHPTLAEAVGEAAHAGLDGAIHFFTKPVRGAAAPG